MPRDISTLLEALPYIRQFHGQTIVIKYGGAAMVDDQLRESFARDVVLLKYVGLHPVIVHGGGNEITGQMDRLGLEVKFVDGLRVTDSETVDVARMVLIGKVNKDIVQRINRHGQYAVGISGDDGGMFRVSRATPGGHDVGFVGKVDHVNTGLLDHIRDDYISVIAPVGSDRDGQHYNINADEAAGAVAHALGASKSVFLTDVAGWLADPSDPGSLITRATTGEVERALESVEGGMRPKLEACINAIRGGGSSASIVDGRAPHSILLELFTDEGFGTQITPEQ
jgi:acetylglutamate kinase